ncbi:hypothetical protein [Streptomyces sp. NPDC000351]|uniref:hypothetical protein n=1 Tax=Streptomyces sp. NPDC000351 TaxID=3154250 RepID=UPI0033283CA6
MTRPISDLDVPLSTLQVDIWNELHPVGCPVLAYPETRAERPRVTRTRSRAWEAQHGLPVVLVDGITSPVALRGVDPLPDNHPVEA